MRYNMERARTRVRLGAPQLTYIVPDEIDEMDQMDEKKQLRFYEREMYTTGLLPLAAVYGQKLPKRLQHYTSRAFLTSLLPKYIQPGGLEQFKKTKSLDWLTGIRGIAAVIVVNHHFYWRHSIFQLPFLTLANRFPIGIFFIISGLVLTRRMLGLIRHGKDAELLNGLASAAFRRYLRLYSAAILSLFISFVLVCLNAVQIEGVEQLGFFAQVVDFIADVYRFCDPFTEITGYWYFGGTNNRYNSYLWTIPTDFRGSVFVYMVTLACCRLSLQRRMNVYLCLGILCTMWSGTYAALFLFGMYLAERSITEDIAAAQKATAPVRSVSRLESYFVFFQTWILTAAAILLGLYWTGDPDLAGPSPWAFITNLIPTWAPNLITNENHFFESLSAVILLWGLERNKVYQKPLNWPIVQYVGSISFGLYAMQMPVKCFTPLNKLFFWTLTTFGNNNIVNIVNYFIFMFILFWVADMFSRADVVLCRWVRRIEGWAFSNGQKA